MISIHSLNLPLAAPLSSGSECQLLGKIPVAVIKQWALADGGR